MNIEIPSAADLAGRLKVLTGGQMADLARKSGVPYTTLWKIQSGVTPNPGIETVRRFLPHLPELDTTPVSAMQQGA